MCHLFSFLVKGWCSHYVWLKACSDLTSSCVCALYFVRRPTNTLHRLRFHVSWNMSFAFSRLHKVKAINLCQCGWLESLFIYLKALHHVFWIFSFDQCWLRLPPFNIVFNSIIIKCKVQHVLHVHIVLLYLSVKGFTYLLWGKESSLMCN